VDIAAVFIGAGTNTLTVAADGTTTGSGTDAQRLAVLDADSTAEAIAMLREAHTDNEPGTPHTPPASHPHPPVQAATSPYPQQAAAAETDAREEPADQTDRDDPPMPALTPGQPDTARVQVRVLGHPAILDATGQPAPKLRAKSLELLVYLAVNRNGAKLTDIMEAIWPDATVRRAEQRLSTCAANLRGVIRAVATTTHPPTDTDEKARGKLEPVINTGGFYRLDPSIVTVDWWTMLDQYAQVADATDDQHRLGHLLAAIADIHGPLADDTDYDWIDTDRERVRRHHIKLLAHTADLLADQDPHTSRALLDDACALDPLSDELARRAMRVDNHRVRGGHRAPHRRGGGR
jgi:DNA-binding SARP family transcriptional activator